MMNVKYSMIFSLTLLLTGISGEAGAASCDKLIDELTAWQNAPCHAAPYCKNVIDYQMTVMNNNKFVGYSAGRFDIQGATLSASSAETLFSDRRWRANCTPASGLMCLDNQPFDYQRPETWAFEIKKPSAMNLDFTSWNEHYTISLSCKNGYMYGFQPGKLMIMLYPKKGHQDIPR
jgi:hypothetical protein